VYIVHVYMHTHACIHNAHKYIDLHTSHTFTEILGDARYTVVYMVHIYMHTQLHANIMRMHVLIYTHSHRNFLQKFSTALDTSEGDVIEAVGDLSSCVCACKYLCVYICMRV